MPVKTLPFKTQPAKPQEAEIGDPAIGVITLPKYGCLTVTEQLTLSDVWGSVDPDELLNTVKLRLITPFLQSRLDSDWTYIDTRAIPNFGLIDAIYEFMNGEARRWVEVETTPEAETKKKPTGPKSTG